MKFGSVCSGIEAASQAWHPLGWKAQWFSEIEPFPCAVLAHHYPTTPNLGDMTKYAEWPEDEAHAIDLLCGGTPCQSFSVAGLRKGLDDPRGNLMLTFGAIAAKYRPRWLVWENVPGVLSSNGGRDFGTFLGMLGQLGYGFAYRVLDAQYFGVAQRRRRVFVVGCLGDWRAAAAVLFERHSLSGNPAPRRETGQTATPTIRAGAANGGAGHGARSGDSKDELITVHAPALARCDATREGSSQDWETTTMVAHSLRGEGFDASEDGTGRGMPLVPVAFQTRGSNLYVGDISGTIGTNADRASGSAPMVCFDTTQITSKANFSNPQPGDPCHPLAAGAHAPAIAFTGEEHASPQEADAIEALRVLRQEVGEEAFAVWRSGVLNSFQPSEILRQGVHGQCLRREALEAGRWMDDGALPREAIDTAGSVQDLWQAGRERRSPQGRGLPQQFARQLNSALSQLPHEGAQPGWLLQGLWGEGEGVGLLQQALHPAQGRPALQVRRLTPVECEKLQGFPPGYTAIPWRGKPSDQCPDGPRYKALGNSWAVPCIVWLGKRIQLVEEACTNAKRAA